MGIPASGNAIKVTGSDTGFRRDGKIAEARGDWDMMDLMTQLGPSSLPPTDEGITVSATSRCI